MSPKDRIDEIIASKGHLLLDGGLAAELEAQGHDLNHRLWSARLLVEDPAAIVDAHLAFLRAGADCLISSSYQATPQGLRECGASKRESRDLIRLSHRLALDAGEQIRADGLSGSGTLVAASIGPYGAYLADGSEYRGNPGVSVAELLDFHRERFEILAEEADLLAIETLPSIEEATALRELLEEDGRVAAWVSFTCRDGDHLASGQPLSEAAALLSEMENVVAVGVNCTAPAHLASLIEQVRHACPCKEVVVYPNSGETYSVADKSWSGEAPAESLLQLAPDWREQGARLIGGCCRVPASKLVELGRSLGGPAEDGATESR